MAEKQIEKFTFPVKGFKVAGGNMYFQINYKGHEYDIKAFTFQRTRRPQKLVCLIKGTNAEGFPVFTQDLAAIIPQIYNVGEEYEFRVKSPFLPAGYHEVIDTNGLLFRVYPGRHERLRMNEVVKCRVKSINLVRMDLELLSARHRGIPFFTLEQFVALDTTEDRVHPLARMLFRQLPELADARELLAEGNPLWVMACVDLVDRHLTEWLKVWSQRPNSIESKRQLLRSSQLVGMFNSICLNVLETSDYLRQCSPAERGEYQDRLNKIITHSRDYMSALQLIMDKKDQTYVDDTLERLRLSGYLYNPEERMRVAMALFSLRKKSVSNYIDAIFDIIRQSHENRRFMHLFAKAFIDMLDMYISNESRHVDSITSLAADPTGVRRMIKALSLRLLLGFGEGDTTQMQLYRSMHYRYVTLVTGVNSSKLLQKALAALFNPMQSQLEFSWNDLDDITMLCSKVAVSLASQLARRGMVYDSDTALMTVEGDQFTFMPQQHGTKLKQALPPDLFAPAKIRVLLNDRIQERLNAQSGTIVQHRSLWREVEQSLFAPVQHTHSTGGEKLRPDVGDVVRVRITGKVPGGQYDYSVEIEDDAYAGRGSITPLDIVSYPVLPYPDMFIDRETGQPQLYEATVESMREDGSYHFVMRDNIHSFLKDELSEGQQCLGQVSKVDPGKYMIITDEGISMFISRRSNDDNLVQGEFVIVEIAKIWPFPQIEATFVERTEEKFQVYDAFRTLMTGYCGGNLYSKEEEMDTDDAASLDDALASMATIDSEHMRELIHLIDREGVLHKDHIETYNYLAIGHIMARLINDSQLATYFANRMELVESIRLFGENGKIDDDRLQKLFADNTEFISIYPDIETRLTRLRIINLLDKDCNNGWLYEKAVDRSDETTSQLARLVISYNMLANSNVFEIRNTLRRKIYQLMDLKVQLPDTLKIAEEDQFTELKTSIIYPAGNNMLPAPNEQMSVILRVIDSFMNARGGRLYVGVDDSGYAKGLHEDFTYINKRHESYDLADVKDKFDRMVRDQVHNRLGHSANSLLTTQFEQAGDKIIYRVDIDPSPEVVMLDGVAYERQGKSNWAIPAAELPKFRARRAKELK